MKPKQMKAQAHLVAFAIILIAAVIVGGVMFGGWSLTGQVQPETQKLTGPVSACIGGQTQSLDINAYDLGTPTTAVTEANNIYRIYTGKDGTGGALGTVTLGTAITTLQPGTDIEFIGGVSGTAANNYDNSYTPRFVIENLPCIVSENIALFQDEVETSVTATFYNSNHDASAETAVASTPTIVYMRFYTADEQYFGNPYLGEPSYLDIDWSKVKVPAFTYIKEDTIGSHRPQYPNIVCIKHNTTNFDKPVWVKAQLQDGSTVEMNEVSVPTVHAASAGDKDYCYEAPILTGTYIEIIAKVNPKAGCVCSGASMVDDTAYYYAAHRYMHTDDGYISWGVEDDLGQAVGASDPDTLTMDWTA